MSLLARVRRAEPVDLRGPAAVVTGASPGSLGFETARALAAWGADVVVTTRTDSSAARDAIDAAVPPSASRGTVTAHPLDLASADSVERFAAWLRAERGERLDVLVNNAGVHLDLRSQWKEPRLTADGVEVHFRTNYLGTAHLTERLLPALLAAAAATGDARVVNVVSKLHAMGRNAWLFEPVTPYDSWAAYGTSKLALVHATFELDRRHAAAGLRAVCLHPGSVFTKIADKGLEESHVLGAIRRVLAPVEAALLLSPEQGAQTQIHCATHPSVEGGRYYVRCAAAPASPETNDRAAAARLAEATRAWVHGSDAVPAHWQRKPT